MEVAATAHAVSSVVIACATVFPIICCCIAGVTVFCILKGKCCCCPNVRRNKANLAPMAVETPNPDMGEVKVDASLVNGPHIG